jgi:hypothetical protein
LRAFIPRFRMSVTVRGILLANLLAHLFPFEPYRGPGVPACPEGFAGEVPLLSGRPRDGDRAMPFPESDHGCHGCFGGMAMHMGT